MTSTPPGPGAAKDDWRRWARRQRASMAWEGLSDAVVGELRGWLSSASGSTVLLYLPMGDEINLLPLTESEQSIRFVATRTPERGDLTIHELGGPLEVHRFGFLQPHASAPEVGAPEIDVALLPGLAFDLYGNRLGHGAGYFDRLLRFTRADARLAGVVPVDLVVDRLPADTHDIPVGYLATEQGVIATA